MKKSYIYLSIGFLLLGGFAGYANAATASGNAGSNTATTNTTTTTTTNASPNAAANTGNTANSNTTNSKNAKSAYTTEKLDNSYVDINQDILTIADLQNIEDDTYVTLKGYVSKKINKKKYIFEDPTGQLYLEVEKEFRPQMEKLNPRTQIEVYGKFDKKSNISKSEIEVKKVTILNQL